MVDASENDRSGSTSASQPAVGMIDLLKIGCNKKLPTTDSSTIRCQISRLCNECEAILARISKAQLIGIIQNQQSRIEKQQRIIAASSQRKHSHLGPPRSGRRG